VKNSVLNKVQDYLGEEISSTSALSGGCISDACKITTYNNKNYFLKTDNKGIDLFRREANGLKELSKAKCIRVPEVYMAELDFLLTEYIETGIRNREFFQEFGKQFSELHRFKAKSFGFFEDNFIGANKQINRPINNNEKDWCNFYFTNRLEFQMKLAEKNGYADTRLINEFTKLENKISDILNGSEEKPSLLHGDLWSGNYMCGQNSDAVLIDPAVYYGHREADLAMCKLFGGFSPEFYISYNESYPLKEGYQYRENIYILYHVLNHLNLFGHGYYNQALKLMNYYNE